MSIRATLNLAIRPKNREARNRKRKVRLKMSFLDKDKIKRVGREEVTELRPFRSETSRIPLKDAESLH